MGPAAVDVSVTDWIESDATQARLGREATVAAAGVRLDSLDGQQLDLECAQVFSRTPASTDSGP